jgi:hypothetical protein
MLLELSMKHPSVFKFEPPKYVLIECNDYFKSARMNLDQPHIIDTNSEIEEKLAKNPYSSCKKKTTNTLTSGGKRNGKMNDKTKTKRKMRKRNKTKKVKRTNRKNSRYIKRK